MSFSSEVKNELLITETTPCCKHAQSYGLLLFGRAFSESEISILTESEDIALAYCDAVQFLSDEPVTPLKTDGGKYKVLIQDRKILDKVFRKLGFDDGTVRRRVNFANLQNPCCFNAFLRGVFLACGTVTDPEKEYHLEFAVSTKGLCDDLSKIFDEFDPTPKLTQRSGSYTVYFKNSADIEDILAIMGASEHSMSYMHAKIVKDIRNTVNRKVNFENANLARTISAATKQYEAIAYIIENKHFDKLPFELREIAMLRYNNRELSNSEIVALLPEKLTVSGANHRFKRLIKIAEDIKK